MDRRRFLLSSGCSALGLALGAGVVWALDEPERPVLPVRLGPLEELPAVGTVRLFPEQEVALIRRGGGLAVLDLRCTHLGCRLRLAGAELVCPCHGGRFDLDGVVRGGPPPRPLPWYEARVSRGGDVFFYPGRMNRDRALLRI